MVATSFGKKDERALEIDLPAAQSGAESEATPEEILVDVTRDGRVFVGGRAVERGALVSALTQAARGRDATPVTVRGDRLTTHETVVEVLDACSLAGLVNLSVGTREHEGGR
jgi:biopolymer transport protein ExbD